MTGTIAMKLKLLFTYLISFVLILSCQTCNRQSNKLNNILKVLHDQSSDTVLTVAHRALHTQYPENSLAAIQHSIDAGLDMIEIDVRRTADDVLILMHDATVNRTTDGEGQVRELTFEQIKKLTLRTEDNQSINHPVPSLEEVLSMAKNHILVDLDIKDAPVKKLVDLVSKTGTRNQVLFFEHHNTVLDSILLLDSTLMVVPRADSVEQIPDFLNRYHPPAIQVQPYMATPDVIQRMKSAQSKVWINALGSYDKMAMKGKVKAAFIPIIACGAKLIQSDRPVLLLDFLKANSLHW
jgi:glycerophosphoryl diester phosphodiesterase